MKEKLARLASISVCVFSIFGLCIIFVPTVSGQGTDNLVLIVDSKITMNPTTPGGGGWETKANGRAYLVGQPNGRFTGSGELAVTYDFLHPPNPYLKYSTLRGRGSFNVKGIKEGKNLRFWFERGNIPIEGTLTVSLPNMSQKKPYVSTFDPHTLAPGGPELERGVTIELRDGAIGSIDIAGMGKTTFTLYGVELWRVSVVGTEADKVQPNIQNKKLRNESKELPIAMQFEWKLAGEFSVIGRGSNRSFIDGSVFLATLNEALQFKYGELYDCKQEACNDQRDIADLVGLSLEGSVSGNTVRIKWPEFFAVYCISCRPLQLYLGGLPYRAKFEAREFIDRISREDLPLADGRVVNGGVQDWLKYTITLRKLN
jgi:hypothetical protein